jgi:hypothetical protein
MTKASKRPRGLNQWAKRMVDIAAGEVSDRKPTPEVPRGVARSRSWSTFRPYRAGTALADAGVATRLCCVDDLGSLAGGRLRLS